MLGLIFALALQDAHTYRGMSVDLKTLAPNANPMAPVVERFSVDRRDLDRVYDVETSPTTFKGRRDFYNDWMNALKAAGLGVGDIDFVMCSHLHGDHVGWNTRMENGRWVPTFPKARYLFSKKEYTYWSEIHQKTPLAQITDSVLPIIEANRAELVTSDHELNDHIRLTPTPGHTPDHFAVCAGKGGDKAVFTGDLIHSPMQARYPELVMRVDTDRDQGVRTRRAFFERYCDTDTLCCTMHFPSPSVGYIKRWDNGFKLEYLT